MAAHQEYWQQLLTDGRVVVYGPVADPEGVWGMGVLRAADRAEVLAIGEADPSVTAGVNTFEVFEIMDGITGVGPPRTLGTDVKCPNFSACRGNFRLLAQRTYPSSL